MEREKVTQYLSVKGLGSIMNRTKWKLLLEVISTLPFPPAFVCKYLLVEDDEHYLKSLDKETVSYWGDWSLATESSGLPNLDEFYLIEYIKIKPSYIKSGGKYVKVEKIDISNLLRTKLKAKNITFEVDDYGNIVIFGYR